MKICPACRLRFAGSRWACPSCAWQARQDGPIIAISESTDEIDGFSPSFFAPLAAAEDHHFWFRARNELIAWALARYFPGAGSLLDAGCGNGQVARALQRAFPRLRLTLAEAFREGLAQAERDVAGADLVLADVRQLPWDSEFDVVGAFDVLEHVSEDDAALAELGRCVRPGGGVILTVPQHPWLWSAVDEFSRHKRRYTRAQLRARIEDAGLRLLRLTSFVFPLLPVLALSRLVPRNRPFDPQAELRISPAANVVGLAAMRLERWLIQGGVSMPAGGSLLAVAQRPSLHA